MFNPGTEISHWFLPVKTNIPPYAASGNRNIPLAFTSQNKYPAIRLLREPKYPIGFYQSKQISRFIREPKYPIGFYQGTEISHWFLPVKTNIPPYAYSGNRNIPLVFTSQRRLFSPGTEISHWFLPVEAHIPPYASSGNRHIPLVFTSHNK